jgi:hypothetical protein
VRSPAAALPKNPCSAENADPRIQPKAIAKLLCGEILSSPPFIFQNHSTGIAFIAADKNNSFFIV